MSFHGNSSRRSRTAEDWSTGPIEKQSELAADAPDVLTFAIDAIGQAGRLGRADLESVLAAIGRVLSGQMDTYVAAFPPVDADQVADMRRALYARPDFNFEMFFHGLTYFGPSGVAVSNRLIEQLGAFQPVLVELIGEGRFDRD